MTSRRWSGDWALPPERPTDHLEVLIPTIDRAAELAVTLAGLAGQDDPPFRVTVSDQSATSTEEHPAVAAMLRVLRAQGRLVRYLVHLPKRGLAEHRQFLLDQSVADRVLFLDDDVWLEPGMLTRLCSALDALDCGFVGAAVQGLSFLHDDRPAERAPFETWDLPVLPEVLRRDAPQVTRMTLHNAANLTHLAGELHLATNSWLAYKIAWVGGCVLYQRQALVACGGFDFWTSLPPVHVGEDVAAQWRVMERFGGAGVLPSGAVHLEAPTTVPDRTTEAGDVVFGRSRGHDPAAPVGAAPDGGATAPSP
ncbi:glycosyltransferase family A protein [Cryobacterium sp.]|uniref:glycosyltransferase family A protein n=1 Tax=Cryobacterium sp. TaxID=1926290 RepID=UPI002629D224|nr:glycosyltransferase family A protein [Cryobacterium sp.]MCU1445939.1 glycosyl transferase [Cryobacterium sp.]